MNELKNKIYETGEKKLKLILTSNYTNFTDQILSKNQGLF